MEFAKWLGLMITTCSIVACGGGGGGGGSKPIPVVTHTSTSAATSSSVATSSSSISTSSTLSSSSSNVTTSASVATSSSSSSSSSLIKSSSSSSTTTSSSSTSSSAPADFVLDQSDVYFKADVTDIGRPNPVTLNGALKNVDPSNVFILADAGQVPFIANAIVNLTDDTHGTLTLTAGDPKDIYPGKHSGIIVVHICKDAQCALEYAGSPKTVQVTYEITAPAFTISATKVNFHMVENQSLPASIDIHSHTSTTPTQWGWSVLGPVFPAWFTVTQSWSMLDGTSTYSVLQSLPAGTYTSNTDIFTYGASYNHRVDVTLVVDPASASSSSSSSSSAPSLVDCAGVIFTDSVCAQWSDPVVFEQDKHNASDYHSISDGSAGYIVTQAIVDSGDTNHNKVIDVSFNSNTRYNGQLSIYAGNTIVNGADMSDYATGKLVFDVKVISKGDANADLKVKIECGWPCQSNQHVVDIDALNTWKTIEIPVADLIADGLNIEHVASLFQIFPEWGSQSNAHFQLDNIRWVQ